MPTKGDLKASQRFHRKQVLVVKTKIPSVVMPATKPKSGADR